MTIDAYMVQLAKLLTVAPATREEILQEVRDHLEDVSHQLALSGTPGPVAEEQAVAGFGNAAQVARRFNTVHPLYWDKRRFAVSVLWGSAATWALWTLLCYPLLVQLAAQHPIFPSIDSPTPWSLLFSATPLGFGVISALVVSRYWFVPLFLFLYCLTPFLWARRAHSGWQPGLAFGLGAILGFVWLPPAIISQWPQYESAAFFVFLAAIWLLAPVAIVAAWAGRLSLAWKPHAVFVPVRAGRPISRWTRRRMTPTAVVIVCLSLALVGVSAWSFVRYAELITPPPLSQQIQTAQANLSFALRQPTFLPPGMVLTFVTGSPNQCLNACAALFYQGAHGSTLTITEVATTPTPFVGLLPSATYQVSQSSDGYMFSHTGWLRTTVTAVHSISISWVRDGIVYSVDADATLSVGVLEHLADSMQ